MGLDREVAAARPGRDRSIVALELSPDRPRAELFVRRVVPDSIEKFDSAFNRLRQRVGRQLVRADRASVEVSQRRRRRRRCRHRRLADGQQRRRKDVLVRKFNLLVADEVPGELGGPRLDDSRRIDPTRSVSFNLFLDLRRDEKLLLEDVELSFEIRFITVGTFVKRSGKILSNFVRNNQTIGFERGRHLLQDEFLAAEAHFVLVLIERVLAEVAAATAADAGRLHRLGARVRVRADDLRVDGRREVSANAADVPRVIVPTPTRVLRHPPTRAERRTSRQTDEVVDQHRGVRSTRRVRVR